MAAALVGGMEFLGAMQGQQAQVQAQLLSEAGKWGAGQLNDQLKGLKTIPQAPLGTGSQNAYDQVIRQAMRSQLGAAAGYQGVGGGAAMTRAALQNVAMTQRDATGGLQAARAQEMQQNQLLRAQQQQQYGMLQAYIGQQLLNARTDLPGGGSPFVGRVGGGGTGPNGTYTAAAPMEPRGPAFSEAEKQAGRVSGTYRPTQP